MCRPWPEAATSRWARRPKAAATRGSPRTPNGHEVMRGRACDRTSVVESGTPAEPPREGRPRMAVPRERRGLAAVIAMHPAGTGRPKGQRAASATPSGPRADPSGDRKRFDDYPERSGDVLSAGRVFVFGMAGVLRRRSWRGASRGRGINAASRPSCPRVARHAGVRPFGPMPLAKKKGLGGCPGPSRDWLGDEDSNLG